MKIKIVDKSIKSSLIRNDQVVGSIPTSGSMGVAKANMLCSATPLFTLFALGIFALLAALAFGLFALRLLGLLAALAFGLFALCLFGLLAALAFKLLTLRLLRWFAFG